MADDVETKREEKVENEGLSPYYGIPKINSLYANTEFVQYLCLMYRKQRSKARVSR